MSKQKIEKTEQQIRSKMESIRNGTATKRSSCINHALNKMRDLDRKKYMSLLLDYGRLCNELEENTKNKSKNKS